jgi:hypothetical protein
MRANTAIGKLGREKAIELRRIPATGPGARDLGLGLGPARIPSFSNSPRIFIIELKNNSDIRKRAHTDFHVSKP